MGDRFKDLCRLCLDRNPDFNVHEDKISTKITALLSVEIEPEPSEFPTKICQTCRVNLEKLYIFRMRSLESDSQLRHVIYGKQNLKDRIDDSISFLKQYDADFNEHDYGEKSDGTGKKLSGNEISEEEYSSIEKTVQHALNQNNYFGQFVLKIEEIEPTGLRKIRVIKDNGANIIMKIRMPEKTTPKKPEKIIPKKEDSLKKILEKCEIIELGQEKISQSILRTEKTVSLINTIVQTTKNSNIEFIDVIGNEEDLPKDESAPFELPINSINELWRLNSRITDPEVREAMNLEMMKLESQPGIKIIGRVVRAVIDKDLLGQLCWSGRVKVEHKYLKSDDKLMLSKMKNIVDYMLEVCKSKEETTNHCFLQTLMNLIRKARFKTKDTSYAELTEFREEYLTEEDYTQDIVEVGEIDG